MSDYSELKKLATTCSIARTGGWQGKMGVDENQILNLLAENEANKERADAEQESFDGQRRILDAVKRERDQFKAAVDEWQDLAERRAQRMIELAQAANAARDESEALRKVADELRRFAVCEHVHHDRADQHEADEPCKVLVRIDAAMSKETPSV